MFPCHSSRANSEVREFANSNLIKYVEIALNMMEVNSPEPQHWHTVCHTMLGFQQGVAVQRRSRRNHLWLGVPERSAHRFPMKSTMTSTIRTSQVLAISHSARHSVIIVDNDGETAIERNGYTVKVTDIGVHLCEKNGVGLAHIR